MTPSMQAGVCRYKQHGSHAARQHPMYITRWCTRMFQIHTSPTAGTAALLNTISATTAASATQTHSYNMCTPFTAMWCQAPHPASSAHLRHPLCSPKYTHGGSCLPWLQPIGDTASESLLSPQPYLNTITGFCNCKKTTKTPSGRQHAIPDGASVDRKQLQTQPYYPDNLRA